MVELLSSDQNEPGYQILDDTTITSTSVQVSNNVDEDTNVEETTTEDAKIPAYHALKAANDVLIFLDFSVIRPDKRGSIVVVAVGCSDI